MHQSMGSLQVGAASSMDRQFRPRSGSTFAMGFTASRKLGRSPSLSPLSDSRPFNPIPEITFMNRHQREKLDHATSVKAQGRWKKAIAFGQRHAKEKVRGSTARPAHVCHHVHTNTHTTTGVGWRAH